MDIVAAIDMAVGFRVIGINVDEEDRMIYRSLLANYIEGNGDELLVFLTEMHLDRC